MNQKLAQDDPEVKHMHSSDHWHRLHIYLKQELIV